MKNYKADIEKILRGQFVDNAYDSYGNTGWGIYNTQDKILSLIREIVQEATDGMDECGKEILSNVEEALK